MNIEMGQRLPEFFASAPPSARYRVLYFMRTADCPVCRGHVRRLTALAPRLAELGAHVTVYAPGAEGDPLPAWVSALPFEFVSSERAHAAVGFGQVLGALQQSGTVVAAADGTVISVRRATLPFQAFDETELLATLSEGSLQRVSAR